MWSLFSGFYFENKAFYSLYSCSFLKVVFSILVTLLIRCMEHTITAKVKWLVFLVSTFLLMVRTQLLTEALGYEPRLHLSGGWLVVQRSRSVCWAWDRAVGGASLLSQPLQQLIVHYQDWERTKLQVRWSHLSPCRIVHLHYLNACLLFAVVAS